MNLLNLSSSELAAQLLPLGVPSYRASQIFHFVYRKGHTSFASMSSLSLALRAHLSSLYTIDPGSIMQQQSGADGTRKLLLRVGGGDVIESVFIPMRERFVDGTAGAVCVSTQVGCSLQCAFCATGAMDKAALRNLRPSEIVAQVLHHLHATGDYARALPSAHTPPGSLAGDGCGESLTNIVFMGMGEPGYNLRALTTALSILSDPHGLAFGRKRITVSTSGVVPAIDRLKDVGVRLAISLHAVTDELRDRLVPINRTWNLHALLQACRRFQQPTDDDGRTGRITFEYVLLAGVNDSVAEARELTRLLRRYGIDALVNLIPFNPVSSARTR